MPSTRDLEYTDKQLGRRLIAQEQVGAESRLTDLETKLWGQFYHHETFESIEPAFTEDLVIVIPAGMASLLLDLRGRAQRGGLVASHGHTLTIDSTDLGSPGTGDVNQGHTHPTQDGGDHGHNMLTNVDPGSPKALTATSVSPVETSGLSRASGPHNHGSTQDENQGHSHSTTIGSHGHSGSSGTTGSGGTTSPARPTGVSVTVDGIDRTIALGGAWGGAGADWDVQNLDILQYLQGATVGAHTIILGCTSSGRLKATVRGQML